MAEIRALRPDDDRTRFRSGDPALDFFFLQYAGQNQFRHHIGSSYVAIEDDVICGYATVSPAHMEAERVSAAERRRLPAYPLPVLRLARLAVAQEWQGRGIGKALLKYVLNLSLRMGDEFGCVGVVVDAKPTAVEFYGRLGFVELATISGESALQPVPLFLARSRIGAG